MATTPRRLPAELVTGPVVVRAWAPWCSSCRALAPHVQHAATRSGVPVVDLRVDDDADNLVELFEVRSVPTLIGLHDGNEVARLTGARAVDAIETLFTAARTGTGSVISTEPPGLVVIRAGAGGALVVAGIALDSVVLVSVGAALLAWALASFARRAT